MKRRAFTLVEILVVIGIITLLIALLMPMIARAYRTAERARVAGDLQAISSGLEAYKQDFGYYPNTTATGDYAGAHLLCVALIGPGPANGPAADGADGPGFRVTRFPGLDGNLNTPDDDLPGKIYPPYLQPDRFKMVDSAGTLNSTNWAEVCIADRFRKPILYYPAQGHPNITYPLGYIADNGEGSPPAKAMYNSALNAKLSKDSMRVFMGDTSRNGQIEAGAETAKFTGPYILWSAGPDETYGPQPGDAGPTSTLDGQDANACDDITNFRS